MYGMNNGCPVVRHSPVHSVYRWDHVGDTRTNEEKWETPCLKINYLLSKYFHWNSFSIICNVWHVAVSSFFWKIHVNFFWHILIQAVILLNILVAVPGWGLGSRASRRGWRGRSRGGTQGGRARPPWRRPAAPCIITRLDSMEQCAGLDLVLEVGLTILVSIPSPPSPPWI